MSGHLKADDFCIHDRLESIGLTHKDYRYFRCTHCCLVFALTYFEEKERFGDPKNTVTYRGPTNERTSES